MFTEANVDFENTRVVVLPVAYDGTSTGRKGARYGPQAILNASQWLELWDIELNFDPSEIGIHTLPELEPLASSPEQMIDLVHQKVKELIDRDKFPVIIGGEHSISLGAVKAIKEKYPNLSCLVLDAHADLRDEYEGSKYSHACVTRRIQELVPVVISGVRSLAKEEAEYLSTQKAPLCVFAKSLQPEAPKVADIISELSDEVYLSVDIDVLDTGIMPSVGTPEPGGLLWDEILKFLKTLCKSKRIVGFDVVELCPIPENQAPDYLAAKLIYKILGYVFSQEKKI